MGEKIGGQTPQCQSWTIRVKSEECSWANVWIYLGDNLLLAGSSRIPCWKRSCLPKSFSSPKLITEQSLMLLIWEHSGHLLVNQISRPWTLFFQMLTGVKISRGKTIPMTYLIQEWNKFNVYHKRVDTNGVTWAMEAWGFPTRFLNVRLDTHFSWWRKELAYVICRKTAFVFFLFPKEIFSNTAFVSW